MNQAPIECRFFEKDFRRSDKGIVVTDNLLGMRENVQFSNLPAEIEARWRLVETAWELRISHNLLQVSTYQSGDEYFFRVQDGRTNITSARDALNGYQKGHCFYCFSGIALDSSTETFMDVDHFLPWMLRRSEGQFTPEVLNGVWNLVLACKPCNRGTEGKSSKIPAKTFLHRLQRRNDYLISSHHPLRETLMEQTGLTVPKRKRFLNNIYDEANSLLGSPWEPKDSGKAVF